jgi:hypothetical protein
MRRRLVETLTWRFRVRPGIATGWSAERMEVRAHSDAQLTVEM